MEQVGEDGKVPYIQGSSVHWGTGRFRGSYHCEDDETPFLTPDKALATCCQEGESLKGSAKTEWHCCAEGHDLSGSADVGFECCVKGSVFDGAMCKKPVKCPNGQKMVDGECQCPPGKIMTPDGACKAEKDEECSSGLETGTLTSPNS